MNYHHQNKGPSTGNPTAKHRDIGCAWAPLDWIGLCSVLRPHQHSIGYMGDGFLQVKRPNQQYQSTEGDATKEKAKNENN